MNSAVLLSTMASLPEDLQLQLADYAEYLVHKAEKQQKLPVAPKPIFGSAKGMFKMRADFDEPLADFEPYMTP